MEIVSDKSLLLKVNQRLARMGGAQGHITASARMGEITLAGMLQYETQRGPLTKAAGAVPGVRRVIDQMQVDKKKKVY